LVPGRGTFQGSVWANHVGLASDPVDPSTIFQGHQYANADGGWATRVMRISGQAGTPSGTVLINNGSVATDRTQVSLNITWPADAPVTQMRVSNAGSVLNGVLTHGKTLPIGKTVPWDLGDASTGGQNINGPRRVYAQFGDGAGVWSVPVSDSIIKDAIQPVLSPLTADWIEPSTVSSEGVPTLLEWTASDEHSGLNRITVERWCAPLGSGSTTIQLPPTATSYVLDCLAYFASVRAFDKAGNLTNNGWNGMLQTANVTAFTTTGTWSTSTSVPHPSSLTGTRLTSSTAGSTAAITRSASRVGLVFVTGPSRGEVNVYVDGTLDATIDTFADTAQGRQLLWSKSDMVGAHSVTLEVVGTSGRPAVVFEGMIHLDP
jgi:hypothetical protein